MLTASQLDLLPLPVLSLFERYHISILEDIARRIANLDYASAAWQAQRLNEAGLLYQDILQRIANISGESESVLRRIFQEAGVKAFRFDDRIYKAAGLKPLSLNIAPNVMEALMVGLRKTQGTLQNLVQSTAVSGQDAFYNATDLAYMQISTGTLDYNTAIRDAVTDIASQGIDVIYYASGHRDKIDVAVRRATLTGVNQTVGEMTIARADDMGVDLVETSAHIGARNKGDVPENHELWQGKVFTRGLDPKNKGKYPDFEKVTGYGMITGLMGINCVLGDTRISNLGIRAGYRRKYTGEIITIKTASGKELSVTPNHPILTDKGWIAANFLIEGDNVISRSLLNGKGAISPYIHKRESRIKDIFNSLFIDGVTTRFPVSSSDFHGDTTHSKVDIVFSDSFLRDSFNASTFKYFKEVGLSLPPGFTSSLKSFGALNEVFPASFGTAHSVMGSLRQGMTLFLRHAFQSGFHSLRTIFSNWNTKFCKVFSNCTLRQSDFFSNFIFPHTGFVHSKKFFRGNTCIADEIGFPISSSVNIIPFETIDDCIIRAAIFIRNFLGRRTALIHRDNIINIERKSSKGSSVHVYNLSTNGEWYFANDIISHNCRHSFSPFFEGLSERNYDKKTLDEYANKKVTYQGEEMSWYDATQEQRKIEREIREAKRVAAAVEAAGLDAGDEKTVIRQLQAEMRSFVNQTGLNRQYPREQVE